MIKNFVIHLPPHLSKQLFFKTCLMTMSKGAIMTQPQAVPRLHLSPDSVCEEVVGRMDRAEFRQKRCRN